MQHLYFTPTVFDDKKYGTVPVPNLHAIKGGRETKYKKKHKVLLYEQEMHQINLNVQGYGHKYVKFKCNITYIKRLFIKHELGLQ